MVDNSSKFCTEYDHKIINCNNFSIEFNHDFSNDKSFMYSNLKDDHNFWFQINDTQCGFCNIDFYSLIRQVFLYYDLHEIFKDFHMQFLLIMNKNILNMVYIF